MLTRPLPIVALCSFLAQSAWAQTSSELELTSSFSITEIGIDDCADDIDGQLNLSGNFTNSSSYSNYELRLTFDIGQEPCSRDTLNSCPKYSGSVTAGCGCLKSGSTSSISYTGNLSDILENLGQICDSSNGSSEIRFYLEYYNESDSSNTVELRSTAQEIHFDFSRPDAPSSAPRLSPGEEAITVRFDSISGSDIAKYEVCYKESSSNSTEDAGTADSDITEEKDATTETQKRFKAASDSNESLRGDFSHCSSVSTGESSHRIEGLSNDTTYEVVYAAIDNAGNRGPNSPSASAAPAEVDDFAEVYSKSGGREEGGCSSLPGLSPRTPLWLIAALVMVGLARCRLRRKSLAGLNLLVLFALLPATAHAYRFGTETPRSTSVELRLTSFQPGIDKEFSIPEGQSGPYERIFGNDGDWLFSVAVSEHFFQAFGTASLGGSIGFWSAEGSGISASADDVSDKTSFHIFPMALEVSYRLDEWQAYIPLVPVARLGLDYYFWYINDGNSETARFANGNKAMGGTWGWHYTLGIHILLDFFAEGMAGDFDNDAGVNNSYFTIEFQSSHVDDFGSSKSFRLGDNMWVFGLGLDM